MVDREPLDLSKVSIEPIRKKPDRLVKFCDDPEIDKWVEREAFGDHIEGHRRVYCAYIEGSNEPAAFYSLLMEVAQARKPQPIAGVRLNVPFPALGIGYLAVKTPLQRRGLGTLVLADALAKAVALSEIAAFPAVKLRAAKPWLIEYYAQRSFVQYDKADPQRMLVPTRTLIEAARKIA